MKALLKPTFVMSFILMLTGLVPGIAVYMPILGFAAWFSCLVSGVWILGGEDREYEAQLELIRLEKLKIDEICKSTLAKYSSVTKDYEDLKTQISKAISENRTLAGQIR